MLPDHVLFQPTNSNDPVRKRINEVRSHFVDTWGVEPTSYLIDTAEVYTPSKKGPPITQTKMINRPNIGAVL